MAVEAAAAMTAVMAAKVVMAETAGTAGTAAARMAALVERVERVATMGGAVMVGAGDECEAGAGGAGGAGGGNEESGGVGSGRVGCGHVAGGRGESDDGRRPASDAQRLLPPPRANAALRETSSEVGPQSASFPPGARARALSILEYRNSYLWLE